MEFKKELFEKYEIRKSKKQKTEFIDWVTKYAQDKGFNVVVEKGSSQFNLKLSFFCFCV